MTSQSDVSTAASGQSPYSTAPLNYAEQEIRLLKLERSDIRGKVKCTMLSCPVVGPLPPYIALSYTWGGNVPYADIQINGHCFSVSRNLWHFLHQMRLSQKFGTYWIDAICIDQGNLHERNHQVQMMELIYRKAESVYAWLGEEDEAAYSNAAMTYLEERDVFEADTFSVDRFWTPGQAKAVLSICNRPYWTRIWIVQELVLAQRVVVLCGPKAIPCYHFQRFFDAIATIVQLGWGEKIGISPDFASAASNIMRIKSDLKEQSRSLVALLTLCRHQQSTDIRDKIYALLGLAKYSNRIMVDYGISVETLFDVVLEHTCMTYQTNLEFHEARKLEFHEARKHVLQVSQLLRDVLGVDHSDVQLEFYTALCLTKAP